MKQLIALTLFFLMLTKRHVDIVVNHYSRVEKAIQNATCSTADAAARAAVEQMRKLHVNYDFETQGIVLH